MCEDVARGASFLPLASDTPCLLPATSRPSWRPEWTDTVVMEGVGIAWSPRAPENITVGTYNLTVHGGVCISHLHRASSSTHLALIFTKVLKKKRKGKEKEQTGCGNPEEVIIS